MPGPAGFKMVAQSLVDHVRERIRRGEISEAALAALLGYSQPHIHNVLKGKRGLSFALADDLLEFLNVPLNELLASQNASSTPASDIESVTATLLHGYLGAGSPYPVYGVNTHKMVLNIPWTWGTIKPLLVRISPNEMSMWPAIQPLDVVAIDTSPEHRKQPYPGSVYALCWRNRGYLGRCRWRGGRLEVRVDNTGEFGGPPASVALDSPEGLLDVVRGRVIWLGRELDAAAGTCAPG